MFLEALKGTHSFTFRHAVLMAETYHGSPLFLLGYLGFLPERNREEQSGWVVLSQEAPAICHRAQRLVQTTTQFPCILPCYR